MEKSAKKGPNFKLSRACMGWAFVKNGGSMRRTCCCCWLLSAWFPTTDAKFTEKSTCMSFLGEKAEGRKFLLIFQIKILINISKLCNGYVTYSSFSRWCRLQTYETLNNSFFLIFCPSRQCSYKNFTEHLLHSMKKFYLFVPLGVLLLLSKLLEKMSLHWCIFQSK